MLREQNIDIFNQLDLFLKSRNINYADSLIFQCAEERRKSNGFDLPRHIKGLIYALLSNHRKWEDIEPKLDKIDKLFSDYNVSFIMGKNGHYFAEGIFTLKAGNIATKNQMANLHYNISILERIEKENGGIDFYYPSMPANELVKILSGNGPYKLRYVGKALAWEYLRNVGIDGIKPDVHTRRIMGTDRLGYSEKSVATEDEVVSAAEVIANHTRLSLSMIDALLWSFCAEGRADICGNNPNCDICPIKKHCHQIR